MQTKVRVVFNQYKSLLRKLVELVSYLLFFSFLLHPGRFATTYIYIDKSDIPNELVSSPLALKLSAERNQPLCSLLQDNSEDILMYPEESTELDNAGLVANSGVKEGGIWQPNNCISQYEVAIVIPYRNRTAQLNTFLQYMHPFLQKQMLNYRIVVVEQSNKEAFNRAKLFNIGYRETMKVYPYSCFIFHDVDLIPQKLSNIYACTHQPRHMSSSINTFRYNLPYRGLFGGVVALQQSQFELVNGFSNVFFGWGGEDDDFLERVEHKDMHICRFPPEVSRYIMLAHTKAKPSENRFFNLQSGRERFDTDGLNSLQYKFIKKVLHPLYTRILVDL